MTNSRTKMIVAAVSLVMMISSALFLSRLQGRQKLSEPGVKLGNTPLFDQDGKVVTNLSVSLPAQVPGFKSSPVPVSTQELSALPKDTLYGKRRYTAPDHFWIDSSVVLMGLDRTSIHKPEFCLVGQGWAIEKQELVYIPFSKPFPCQLPAMRFTASLQTKDKQGKPITIKGNYVFWFVAENLVTAKHSERVLWLARDLLTKGILDRWAYISFFSVCLPGNEDKTFDRMKSFISLTVPEFQTAWPSDLAKGKLVSAEKD